MGIAMNKRIVILLQSGIHRIIGHADVPPDAVFEKTFNSEDHGMIEFVDNRARYLLYKEISA
jgi:hypothetical protein